MLLHLGSKGFAICRGFMALPDLFPFEKLVPVCTALEITGCSQYFPHTKPHGNLPVLQHLKKEIFFQEILIVILMVRLFERVALRKMQ